MRDELEGWAFVLVFGLLYALVVLAVPTFLAIIGAP
jgi:hypothetical protein